MTDKEKKDIIQKLITECKWHFDNADNYYSLKSEFDKREQNVVKPLGKKLYDAGGISLMREVYQTVEEYCMSAYGKHCRSALDMKWNGVGSWMG